MRKIERSCKGRWPFNAIFNFREKTRDVFAPLYIFVARDKRRLRLKFAIIISALRTRTARRSDCEAPAVKIFYPKTAIARAHETNTITQQLLFHRRDYDCGNGIFGVKSCFVKTLLNLWLLFRIRFNSFNTRVFFDVIRADTIITFDSPRAVVLLLLSSLVDYYPMRNESNYLRRLIYVIIIIATRKEYPLCEVKILIKFLGALVAFSLIIREDPPLRNNNNFDPDDFNISAYTARRKCDSTRSNSQMSTKFRICLRRYATQD